MSPAGDLDQWCRETFITEGGKLYNEEHAHLHAATIGFLWADVENARRGRQVIGQCETGVPMAMGKWAKARLIQQLVGWFGLVPDFVITLDAEYCRQCSDVEFCALVEHELLHAGQDKDEFGMPAFTKAGLPKLAIRGHDVEEFVSIVARYGAGAAKVQDLVDAANRGATIAHVHIAQACGTCQLRRVA